MTVEKKQCHLITADDLSNRPVIVSNFTSLSSENKSYLMSNSRYLIYEHDHKYIKRRNPALYKDYLAPKSEIINYEFYKKAAAVICQTEFHKNIIHKNLELNNIISVGGNFWTDNALEVMTLLESKKKKDRYSILNSNNKHKNTSWTRAYCERKNIPYDLVASTDYAEFLMLLSKNKTFVFFPQSPETLSRIVVEARMMGMKTVTNKHIGAIQEPWFSLKGPDLIEYMRNKRQEISDRVLEVLIG